MKKIVILTVGAIGLLCGFSAHAELEARCDQMNPVVYAGGFKQPVMRIKITNSGGVQSLKSLKFSLRGTTRLSDISKISVYYSGATPYFSPNSGSVYQTSLVGPARVSSLMQFEGSQVIETGDNYLWLVCDVSDRSRGKDLLDAECLNIEVLGETPLVPENASPAGAAQVYQYQSRIIPYYRSDFLVKWNPNLLTTEHFVLMTDLIYFSVGLDNEGNVTGATGDTFLQGIDRLKSLRGKNEVNLILGVTPNRDTMSSVTANAQKRRKFAKGLVSTALEKGFMGLDIDWEYPNSDVDWSNYALFLNDVREELSLANCPAGFSVSIAVAMYYKKAPAAVCDQIDFLNNMSYDGSGQHSTMALMQGDVAISRGAGLPDYKIICGLPFYSNETRQSRDWDQQQGYDSIIGWFPTIDPGTNTFIHPTTKQEHYFNGVTLIKQKAKYVKDNKLGGMMIWAYDRDVPLSNGRSLARAISQMVRPLKQ